MLIEPSEDAGPGIRLQKVMAAAGIGSRRLCEDLIEQGRVRVNGHVVNRLPAWVDPQEDEVEVAGHVLPKPERHVYVMLYKPRNTVSTLSDPDGRRTVSDVVQHPSGARLYPVGRLDYDTMGLLLLTNDGELANRLTHPRYGVHKTYRALVRGNLTAEAVAQLERGIFLAERKEGRTVGAERTGGARLELVRSEKDRSVIDITLSEGRNRQVRRMLASVGCLVKKLVRIRMGPIRLRGVALGQWRELTRDELRALREAAGLVRASAAGKKSKPKGVKAGAATIDADGYNVILPGDAGAEGFDEGGVW